MDSVQAPVQEGAPPKVDKRVWTESWLSEVFRLMDLPVKMDLKDGADGGISVALFFQEEVPGTTQGGRRSHFIESLQFLANKVVNRSAADRRWISLGVNAHPEPRVPGERPPKRTQAPQSGPVSGAPVTGTSLSSQERSIQGPPRERPVQSAARAASPAPARVSETDEASLEVSEDEALAAIALALAEKSARLGRPYAIVPMKADDRARILKATEKVVGVKLKAEGEGRLRRLVFHPDKLVPMPKLTLPDYDDEEEDG
jgi:predicted RNA-binding protein Jag